MPCNYFGLWVSQFFSLGPLSSCEQCKEGRDYFSLLFHRFHPLITWLQSKEIIVKDLANQSGIVHGIQEAEHRVKTPEEKKSWASIQVSPPWPTQTYLEVWSTISLGGSQLNQIYNKHNIHITLLVSLTLKCILNHTNLPNTGDIIQFNAM